MHDFLPTAPSISLSNSHFMHTPLMHSLVVFLVKPMPPTPRLQSFVLQWKRVLFPFERGSIDYRTRGSFLTRLFVWCLVEGRGPGERQEMVDC